MFEKNDPGENMFKNFNDLNKKTNNIPKTLVVAAAHDIHTLRAVNAASKELKMQYILVGRQNDIQTLSEKAGIPISGEIIDEPDEASCARRAVSLIRNGSGNALMKGLIETGTLLKEVLDTKNGIKGSGTLSHLAVLETPAYHKLIGITDGGMIPAPTFEQKVEIVKNTAGFYNKMGYKKPKIAALCASEAVSPKIPETIDAAELQAKSERGELGRCLLEGPLSFDLAINKKSAETKGITSQISGEADILLVPGITTGNVLAKGLIYWAGAKMAGCILGAKTPIILTSRGAGTEEKILSIKLCLFSE